ncbi:MAG: endonuclease V [Acidilobus sp.]
MRRRAPDRCAGIRSSFSYERAVRAQQALRSRVTFSWPGNHVLERGVIAVDASYWGAGESYGIAVAIALGPSGRALTCYEAYGPVCVPYIPGLLAFREAQLMVPALRAAVRAMGASVVLVDGHGIAHPRRFGIASHLGVVLSIPSIGVAKGLLYGSLAPCPLGTCIEAEGEVLGAALEVSGRRIYVSPGNMVDVAKAVEVVKSMLREGVRLPYPLADADRISKLERKRLSGTRPDILNVGPCDEAIELALSGGGQKA